MIPSQLKIKISLFLLTILMSFPTITQASEGYNEFLELYDGLLYEYIVPTQKNGISYNGVNYDLWAKDERHARALSLLLNAEFKKNDLAYLSNLYNFLTIDLIVESGERESIRNLGGFLLRNPWKRYKWTVDGQERTLDEIEHKFMRPLGDARIHFTINCAAISCPDLRAEAYRKNRLDEQFDEQVRLSLKNTNKGMRLEEGTIYLTKIMEWFREDFKNGNLIAWLNPYLETKHPENTEVKFLPYDWSLNIAK